MSRLLTFATVLLAASMVALLVSSLALLQEATVQPPSPAVTLPSLRAEYDTPTLVLKGSVPDESERQTLLRRAHALYGSAHVVDEMKVGPVANPAWLLPAFLPDLRGTRHARVQLDDARLVIEGEANSETARAAVIASVAAYREGGVAVVDRLRVVSPAP